MMLFIIVETWVKATDQQENDTFLHQMFHVKSTCENSIVKSILGFLGNVFL